jgi:uncharacterized protein YjiS (DUF1127 family)
MKTSIRALAMGVALARPTTAYANENRNIIEELFFGSASPQRHAGGGSSRLCVCGAASPTMRDSHSNISGSPADETTQIALIPRFFDFTWNGPRRWTEASNAKSAYLALLFRTYRFLGEAIISQCSKQTVQQTDSLPEQNRNKKMISLKTISEKLNARRRYRAAVSELSKLSDHELSDIGIGRGDIEHVARRPVASKASA